MKSIILALCMLTIGTVMAQSTTKEHMLKKGNIKVSVLYPSGEGKTFDMEYYTEKHLPMAAGLLGTAVQGVTLEEGISGGTPDSQPTYLVMTNLYFESIEAFQNAFGPNAEKIMGDLPNFTNCTPVIQISKVLL